MAALAHKGQVIMGGDNGVMTFNGRSGSVLPVAGDYNATQVNYSAQQTVKQKIDALVTGVSSFNGRSGSILPVAGDYDATQVSYSSGTSVKQKIDNVAGTWTTVVSCLTGDSSVTINNANIHATSIINPYIQTTSGSAVAYTSIVITEGKAVITFASALTESASVKLQILNL